MKKQKTREELDDDKIMWMVVSIIGWGILFMFIIVLVASNQTAHDFQDLETQLSECQEQIPKKQILFELDDCNIIDFKYYTETICSYNNGSFVFTYVFPKMIDEIGFWNRTITSKPDYCGAILNYALSEKQVEECYK